MNLPNKLTVIRMLMIPLFLVLFFWDGLWLNYLWAFVVFVLASLTDMLDGQIARKRGLVTDFGKLMDPLADKLLVMSAMVSLITTGLVHAVVVVVILAREFAVSAVRQVAASAGVIVAADRWGKLKTVFQMIWICLLLLLAQAGAGLEFSWLTPEVLAVLDTVRFVLTVLVLLLTVLSGINYIWKNKKLFADA